MSAHSNVSPSSAERFFGCPGSVQEQAKIQIVEPPSPYAMEGTAIHELSAWCLQQNKDAEEFRGETVEVESDGVVQEFTVNDDFIYTAQLYCNVIRGVLEENGLTHKSMQVETQFTLPEVDKDARGTTDCSFIAGDTLYVFDLKGGRGVIVSPEENKQLMYYALRPYLDAKLFVNRVVIGIIQPRAKEGDFVKMWETTPARLEEFQKELGLAITKTRVKNPSIRAGKHCKWCKAFGKCGAVQQQISELAQFVAPTIEKCFPRVTDLTVEQIAKALPAAALLKLWFEKLETYAFIMAKGGAEFPGYCLSRGRKNRKYIDEQAVIDEFEKDHGDSVYAQRKILSITHMEKLVGKKDLEKFLHTPEGELKFGMTKDATNEIKRTVEEAFSNVPGLDKNEETK